MEDLGLAEEMMKLVQKQDFLFGQVFTLEVIVLEGDGHLKITNGNVAKIVLSTDDFSTETNMRFIELLDQKFKIRFQLDGQNRLLLYDQFQIIYFLHLVSSWLNESIQRKAMPVQRLRPIAKPTTIYLPENITLTKPTARLIRSWEILIICSL